LRRRQIAEAVRAGKPPGEIARQFGVSLTTVRMACTENGVPMPRIVAERPKKIPPVGRLRRAMRILAELLAGEKSYEQIGARHGVTRQAIFLLKEQAAREGVFEAAGASRTLLSKQRLEIERLERQIAWLQREPSAAAKRNKLVLTDLEAGMAPADVARKYELNPKRVYQIASDAKSNTAARVEKRMANSRRQLEVVADLIARKGVREIMEARRIDNPAIIFRVWRQAHALKLPGVPAPPD
jgi:DNA-binding CsgD family transcriptional regulator